MKINSTPTNYRERQNKKEENIEHVNSREINHSCYKVKEEKKINKNMNFSQSETNYVE